MHHQIVFSGSGIQRWRNGTFEINHFGFSRWCRCDFFLKCLCERPTIYNNRLKIGFSFNSFTIVCFTKLCKYIHWLYDTAKYMPSAWLIFYARTLTHSLSVSICWWQWRQHIILIQLPTAHWHAFSSVADRLIDCYVSEHIITKYRLCVIYICQVEHVWSTQPLSRSVALHMISRHILNFSSTKERNHLSTDRINSHYGNNCTHDHTNTRLYVEM